MNFFRIWWSKLWEDAGSVTPVLNAYLAATAATANQQVIAGVSGKKIIVLSAVVCSTGAVSSVLFKSASAGTNRLSLQLPANTGEHPNQILPFNLAGWIKTNTGEGLFVDNGAAISAISIQYLLVTE